MMGATIPVTVARYAWSSSPTTPSAVEKLTAEPLCAPPGAVGLVKVSKVEV
jgi:hypothetical protein